MFIFKYYETKLLCNQFVYDLLRNVVPFQIRKQGPVL